MVKQWGEVAHEFFGNSLIIHREKQKKLMFNDNFYICHRHGYILRPFFETISAVCSFVKVLIYMNKTLNGRSLVKKLRPCLHGVGDRGLVG